MEDGNKSLKLREPSKITAITISQKGNSVFWDEKFEDFLGKLWVL